jgi:hypothetical protein
MNFLKVVPRFFMRASKRADETFSIRSLQVFETAEIKNILLILVTMELSSVLTCRIFE